ncbi:hypothetical protein Hanom_Chr01g00007261 [Helianthus anomalus]
MILEPLGLFFGGKMSWVYPFHADSVLSNPNPCFRTLYIYLFEEPFSFFHHLKTLISQSPHSSPSRLLFILLLLLQLPI